MRDDASRRSELIEKGRIRACQFSPERMARAHLRAFEEAVEAYSVWHYRWHQVMYQPYHRARVGGGYALARRKEARSKSPLW